VDPTPVTIYRRAIGASVARVWENVLDWEHLPWLHRTTFAFVDARAAGPDGWTAETALRWDPERRFVVAVTLDRPRLCYHTRTIAGPGTGTDIVTRLERLAEDRTGIEVTFLVPDVPPAAVARVGERYATLYARLWDEDEGMMQRRQEVVDGTLAAEPLGLAVDGRTLMVSGTCPHRGGPLSVCVDGDGCITCPWHGYRFDARTGAGVGGHALRLAPWPTRR
jgi:nitrite reductase/ring-hydroxylating ferredoxin subunit